MRPAPAAFAASVTLATAAAPTPPSHPARITFHVVTDTGQPVPGAEIGVASFDRHTPGPGFGRTVHTTHRAVTDPRGLATIQWPCRAPRISYAMTPRPDYYYDHGATYELRRVEHGRWAPWDPHVDTVFKPVGTPIPLHARRVGAPRARRHLRPDTDVGFDLIEGDYLPPLGTGRTPDIVFRAAGHLRAPDDWRSELTVSFPRPGDGIVRTAPWTPTGGSALRSPRTAPAGGYAPLLNSWFERRPGEPRGVGAEPEQNLACYAVRVRSALDDEGRVRSALHGKIVAAFDHRPFNPGPQFRLRFTCYLNPTPNDLNLEFDPSRNLIHNLAPWEEVQDP